MSDGENDLDLGPQAAARAARGTVEESLDAHRWTWCKQLSLWLDALIAIEDA